MHVVHLHRHKWQWWLPSQQVKGSKQNRNFNVRLVIDLDGPIIACLYDKEDIWDLSYGLSKQFSVEILIEDPIKIKNFSQSREIKGWQQDLFIDNCSWNLHTY